MAHQGRSLPRLPVSCPFFLAVCRAFQGGGRDGAPCVGPAEWFGKRAVEVVDEVQESCPQGFRRFEIAASYRASRHNAEHYFNLVQPRTVLRQVDEMNPMATV